MQIDDKITLLDKTQPCLEQLKLFFYQSMPTNKWKHASPVSDVTCIVIIKHMEHKTVCVQKQLVAF